MMKQIPNLARMRAFNGDYTVFTTTTGEQGIADRQGNVIYGPTDKHQHITHSWGTIFEIMTIKPHFQLQQIDARTGEFIEKCIQYPGLGTDIVYREGQLWGVCDADYNIIILPQYQTLMVKQGYYWVQNQAGKWGAIDAKGNQHLPMEYDEVVREAVNERSDMIIVAKDGKYYQIDKDGNPLSKQYNYLRPATAEGYAIIRNEIGLAIINQNEQIIAQTHHQEHYRRNCYPDWLFYWCTPDCIAFCEEGYFGIMNAQGKMIAEPKYSHVMHSNLSDVIIVRESSVENEYDYEGAIRTNGEVVLPMEYQSIIPRKKYNILIIKKNDKYGLVDNQGNMILPMEYDSMSINNEQGLAAIAVSKDGESYLINEKGERVSEN